MFCVNIQKLLVFLQKYVIIKSKTIKYKICVIKMEKNQ